MFLTKKSCKEILSLYHYIFFSAIFDLELEIKNNYKKVKQIAQNRTNRKRMASQTFSDSATRFVIRCGFVTVSGRQKQMVVECIIVSCTSSRQKNSMMTATRR